MVGRTIWRAGNGREALADVQECSGGPPGGLRGPAGGPGVVARPSRWAGSGRDTHGGPGVVRRPSWRAGSGQEALPVDLEVLPVGQEAPSGLD